MRFMTSSWRDALKQKRRRWNLQCDKPGGDQAPRERMISLTSPIWVIFNPKFSPTLTASPTPMGLLLTRSSRGSSLLLENSMIAPAPRRMTSPRVSLRSASLTMTGTSRRRMRFRSPGEGAGGAARGGGWAWRRGIPKYYRHKGANHNRRRVAADYTDGLGFAQ